MLLRDYELDRFLRYRESAMNLRWTPFIEALIAQFQGNRTFLDIHKQMRARKQKENDDRLRVQLSDLELLAI